MKQTLVSYYEKLVLDRSWLVLLVLIAAIGTFSSHVTEFKLDASADALVLENDEDLKFFRAMNRRYGVVDFLILTWSPSEEIFTHTALAKLEKLKNQLGEVDGVRQILSILDLPLLNSPKVNLFELSDTPRTLALPDTDLSLANREFLESPLYKDLVLSADSKTTLLLIYLDDDEKYNTLLKRREDLRTEREADQLDAVGIAELAKVSQAFRDYSSTYSNNQRELIGRVRTVINDNRSDANMFLGGVPMIVTDMINMIESDLTTFGVAVVAFLALVLIIIFRSPRWIVLPLMCCSLTVLTMIGLLGLVDWRVTVVSSNFVALLLIIAMSMTIHLCVRLREVQAKYPDTPSRELLSQTLRFMFKPCIYTSLTTIVAFLSLIVSGIKPVIDFGYMMSTGVVFAFIIIFTLFPSFLSVLKRRPIRTTNDFTSRLTLGFAHITQRHFRWFVLIGFLLLLISAAGISRLEVENRFIDYFHSDTEIHQGMLEIDRKLGGTTPLDIVLNMPKEDKQAATEDDTQSADDDMLGDYFDEVDDANVNYWLSPPRLEEIKRVHEFLEQQPEIGKVMSLATLTYLAEMLNNNKPLNDFETPILGRMLTGDVKGVLYDPYISKDGNEVRLNMRVVDSNKDLKRAELIDKVNQGMRDLGYTDEEFRTNGMLVLYNNMLQSLYESQILTIGFVFLAILGMFIVLFRSLWLALISIFPNALSAALVLGFMGWRGIPLDMMTITIAAISVGIAVDNTIHYIVRFKREFPKDCDYPAAVARCHGSIGKAMYFTSVTIIFGFSILGLSNFIPTIYFGLLTGLAMFVALIASLTLLPSLLMLFKPIPIHK